MAKKAPLTPKKRNPQDAYQIQIRALKHRCDRLEEQEAEHEDELRDLRRQVVTLIEDLGRLRVEVGAPPVGP